MMPRKVIQGRGGKSPIGLLLLAFLTFLLTALNACADLQFDVFVGYDQVLPQHSWFPITCELYNDGPSFNAVIEITPGDWASGQVRRLPIDLPTNTRKRVVIPVFAGPQIWNARLLDSHGNVRAEQTSSNLKIVPSQLPLVAGLSRTVGGMPAFPETASNPSDSKYVVARLQSSLFPDNPLALDGVDMLYISSEKAADLNIEQVNALVAWIQNGGHLVVGVEQVSDVNGTPWLRQLLPCYLDSTINLSDHEALQSWTTSKTFNPASLRKRHPKKNSPPNMPLRPGAGPPPGSPRVAPVNDTAPTVNPGSPLPEDADFESAAIEVVTGRPRDGSILIGDSSEPLAYEGKRGRGRITALCFSPEREPFLSWKNRPWFWARLAGIPDGTFQSPDAFREMGRLSSDGIFGAMIDSRQIRKLPLGWLLALLAAYLVVIGPLDQYWLKKINRQMLTWITFPCYVLIFSGLIYWIGFHLRAGVLEWNELNMVDVLTDGDRAVLRGQTYVSIYSPANDHYELAGAQPFAALRSEALGTLGGGLEGSKVTVDQRGNSFDADAFVPVWTSQLYVSDWLQPATLPLDMTATRQGGGWQVVVDNNLDHALTNANVVLDGRLFTVGPIPSGRSTTFNLDMNKSRVLKDWVSQFNQNFVSAAQNRHNTFGNNSSGLPDLCTASIAASFLSQGNETANEWQTFGTPGGLDLSRYATPGYEILLAWDPDHSPTEPLNHFSVKRSHRNTMLRLVKPL